MSEDSSSIIDATEAAARPNELVLRAVVQSSPLATLVLDRRGTIHVWNRVAEELLGWPAADVVGCRPPFAARDLASDLDDLVARTLRGDAVKGVPGQYVARDGRAVDVDVSMAPLHGPSGRAIGVVTVLAEITARAAAAELAGEREARLLELEEAYRAVIELRTARLTSVDAGPGEQAAARPGAISPRHAAGSAVASTVQQAIERGELRLFFQPIVRLDDARCIGAEALVRWQHPERGLVSPAEFIPLAEDTGLIVPLGAWVLEHAAAQAARWQLEQTATSRCRSTCRRARSAQPDLAGSGRAR